MHGASVEQVAAESDSQTVEMPEFALYGEQVGESLRRVAVAAVAGIDNRYARYARSDERRTLDVMTHGDDVGEAADHAHGVFDGLALAHRRIAGVGEPEYVAAQFHHRGGETQPRAGTRFVEQGGEFAPLATLGIAVAVGYYVFGESDDVGGLFRSEVCRVDKMFHDMGF